MKPIQPTSTPSLCLALLLLPLCLQPAARTQAAVNHVIQISVDGLRSDRLQALINASPESFPGFVRLQTEGAFTFNARCDYDFSVTVPNHATMVSGRPVSQPAGQTNAVHHGFNTNFPQPGDTIHNLGNPAVSYISSVFDVAHDHGLTTAYYVGKTRLRYLDLSYDAVNGAPDLVGEDNGTDKIDYAIVQDGNTPDLIDAITNDLANASVNYTFLHITDPDTAGHSAGWLSLGWDAAALATDQYVSRILDAIDANPALAGQVAVVLTADHGGGGGVFNNHTDATLPENYTIPFFIRAPGVTAGADLHTQFINRADPADGRPDYDAADQPIRDGDAPNVSMILLGLPRIPGSFILPEVTFDRVRLEFSSTDTLLTLSWPASPSYLILESSTELFPTVWERVVNGISEAGDLRTYQTSRDQAASTFYRLRTPAFSIRAHPQPATVHSGASVALNVVTEPAGLRFQWQFNGINLFNETNATLSLTSVQPFHAGDYTVAVSDGIDSLTSDPGTLTLLLNPVITGQPGSFTVNTGDDAFFTVEAFGAGNLTYQWRHNGVDLPGASGDTLAVTNITLADEGSYTVLVSDAVGSIESEAGVLTVFAVPVIVQQPQSVTVNAGETATFTVVVTGNPPPFGYRWRRLVQTVQIGSSDERTSTLVLTNVQPAQAGQYNVTVTNPAFTTPGVTSDRTAILTVLEP